MIDLSELNEIDIADPASWPHWFRWVIIILIAVGVLFGGYKLFIEPEQKSLVKLERNEARLKKTFLQKKELVVNLPAYKQQMLEIQDRFGVVLRQLPDRTEVPALLVDISQAGLARGLKFEQFKPSNPRTEEFYIKLPISITVTGKFHQLAEFISDLASLPRIVTMGNMKISSTKGKGKSLVMEAQLFTYQYLEESSGKATKQKVRVSG